MVCHLYQDSNSFTPDHYLDVWPFKRSEHRDLPSLFTGYLHRGGPLPYTRNYVWRRPTSYPIRHGANSRVARMCTSLLPPHSHLLSTTYLELLEDRTYNTACGSWPSLTLRLSACFSTTIMEPHCVYTYISLIYFTYLTSELWTLVDASVEWKI